MSRLLLSFALCAALLSSCDSGSSSNYSGPSDYVDKYVPVGAKKIIGTENRDDFFGDGRLWEVYELSLEQSEEFERFLEGDEDWKPLPLSEDLSKLSFAYNAELPYDSKEGFYFFYDFQPEWYPEYESNSKPVWDRSSVNFVILLYIPSKKRIYVDNLDT